MTDTDTVELLGGPHDGLTVPRYAIPSALDAELRVARLYGGMIGADGHVVPPSALYRVDVYARCGERRYRYKGTLR